MPRLPRRWLTRARQQIGRAHVQNTGDHVRPLQIASQLDEIISGSAAHGPGQQAVDLLHPLHDPTQELIATAPSGDVITRINIQAIDLLPGILRHGVPRGAQVLASGGQAGNDRAGIVAVTDQELDYGGFIGQPIRIFLKELIFGTHDEDQWQPAEGSVAWQIQQQVTVDVDDTSGVFSPFDLTGHPVDVLGDA